MIKICRNFRFARVCRGSQFLKLSFFSIKASLAERERERERERRKEKDVERRVIYTERSH